MVSHEQPIPTIDPTTLGADIKRRRKALGLTREQLAVTAHLSMATVGRTERGSHGPTLDTLTALAAALGTTVADLLADPEKVA